MSSTPDIAPSNGASYSKNVLNEELMHSSSNRTWAIAGLDTYYGCERTESSLPAGQYIVEYDPNRDRYNFIKKRINLDSLIVLPDSRGEKVLESISHFWNCEKHYRDHGFLWKRGIMLWGPPGSGKTVLLQQLSKQIVDKDGISIYLNSPESVARGLRLLRDIEPNRPVVLMIEDIDAILEKERQEAELLAILDGELQIDNIVCVATTNYPEKLDKRLKNRPSRFDEIVYIGMPSSEARSVYISTKIPKLKDHPEELSKWVRATNKLSIAHIREIIISVECLGQSFDKTVKRIIEMNSANPTSDNEGKLPIGFVAD
jgi:AAA+ superfamily predicted ATPase